MPTFGSLFAGIGGIDLGLERAGWTGRWQVEWDEYCQRVLAKHWPDIPRYGDITTVDWSGVEPVDLIAGGFPCQPFSLAGQRRGKVDDRWLWPAFAASVRALRPRYVLVENVPGLLAGHGGMGSVLGDLAELGYDAEWDSIPAAAVGAPHLRYRVWIVAHAVSDALREQPVGVRGVGGPAVFGHDGPFRNVAHSSDDGPRWREQLTQGSEGSWAMADSDLDDMEGSELQSRLDGWSWPSGSRPLADPNDQGLQGLASSVLPERETPDGHGRSSGVGNPHGSPTDALAEASRPRRPASEPSWWLTEPDVGRVAHGVPARVDRLRSLGNAVVPQVVEVIGRRILEVMQ